MLTSQVLKMQWLPNFWKTKQNKSNQGNKGMCEITETKINQLYYLIKYFLLCYGSSEDKRNIVLEKQQQTLQKKKKEKKRTSASLLAYSTIIENQIQLFSTLAIFDMTIELFSSRIDTFIGESIGESINSLSEVFIVPGQRLNRRHRRKQILPLPSITHRHARHSQSFMYSSERFPQSPLLWLYEWTPQKGVWLWL